MGKPLPKIKEFRDKLAAMPREEILEIIKEQDIDTYKGVQRIEWVFANKLSHLTWNDGQPIEGRDLSNEELAMLVDPPFIPDPEFEKFGISLEQQRELFEASDCVLWAKKYLKIKPRVYQTLILRDPSNRTVLRLGRRAGKTFSLAVLLLHYAFTTTNGRCLVMAPMKSQVSLIYDECRTLLEGSPLQDAVVRAVASPQHEIKLSNGSTIRLFTTGMKSGGRSDVARGQEAHIIVLDEMDYMGTDDLDALYAMLQKTDESQAEKRLIGASTPTGRRERFWQWANSPDIFKEWYFPAYVNPFWNKQMEQEMREVYNEMAYRHEIEADWGEDAEGVYPRRFVDGAFQEDWKYVAARTSARSTYLMGVDWDKHGAGPNICVLEVCGENYEDEKFRGLIRVAHREEIPKHEFVLTEAVERIIELNAKFNPEFIYVDRGYGDSQLELLHLHGMEHPGTNLKTKVKGISFASTLEVRDPATKERVKKEIKPFMVENLRSLLEQGAIMFPKSDEELYLQLISYVVLRTTSTGRPVYEASGSQVDHAHDALILACLAYTQNYDKLFKMRFATRSISFSNNIFNPTIDKDSSSDDYVEPEDRNGNMVRRGKPLVPGSPTRIRRRAGARGKPISRKMF